MTLEGEVELPAIGGVNKKVLIGVGGAAAAFVGWRYWQARQSAAYDPEAAVDPGMEDAGILPAVAGAVRPDNGYGLPDGQDSSDTYGFHGKTNSQWTQYATTRLTQSDRWSYTDVVEALGAYIANRPLTTTQQSIVQAAIAEAGFPPEGSHVIIPGGDTGITVAPGGLRVVPSSGSAAVSWNAVAGASGYLVSRSDTGTAAPSAVSGTSMTMYNLDPGREYKVQVAAVNGAGKKGPWSGSVSFKTPAPTLKAPTGLKVVTGQISKTSVRLQWNAVANARGYRAYRTGLREPISTSTGTSMQIGGLRPNTYYTITVKAESGVGEGVGPGASIKIKTKK